MGSLISIHHQSKNSIKNEQIINDLRLRTLR